MRRGKFLHTEKIKDHKYNGSDVDLSVYGVFETLKTEWKYYVSVDQLEKQRKRNRENLRKKRLKNEEKL
jgi:hypothetical protein